MSPSPSAAIPPNRSHIDTEKRNPRSKSLHTMSIEECVEFINQEDRHVFTALKRASHRITRFIQAAEPGFLAGGRLIYLGAGTSGRLGVLDASEAPPTFCVPPDRIIGIIAGGDGSLRKSSEGKEDDPAGSHAELDSLGLTSRDAVLGIAAGGTTPYVLGALQHCLARGPMGSPSRPLTGLLTCATPASLAPTVTTADPSSEANPDANADAEEDQSDQPSTVTPTIADHLVVLKVGPEVLTGSTRMKAGTATKLALNTISTTLMVRAGKVYENLMVDVRATNDKLRDRAARIIATLTGRSREASFELLEQAGASVKAAIVMHRLSLDRSQAEAKLHAAAGRLDVALGEALATR